MMLFLTVGLFVSSTLGWLWYVEKRTATARQSSLDLLWMEQFITNKLESQQVILQNWALDLKPTSSSSREEFLRRADSLIKENHAILAIEVIDQNNQRLIGIPEYVQRPSNLPPLNDPLVSEAILQSRTRNETAYSRVIEQFAPLWILALPNPNEVLHDGNILVTYDLDKLLTQEVPWWFIQRYDLSLVDKNDKQLSPSESGAVLHGKDSSRLDFGPANTGLSLKTSLRATQNVDNLLIALSSAVLLFGVLIIYLLRLLQRWLKERKATQQTIRERDELIQHTARLSSLAEFASGMAHELNQPLAAIANYAAAAECMIAEKDYGATHIHAAKIRQAIEKMGEESRRAGKIMHSMRSFIQKSATPHEPYSLPHLLNESIELIEAQAKRQQVQIQLESQVHELIIACDAVMLKQVLFNLMRNALEAMEDLASNDTTSSHKSEAPRLQLSLKQDEQFVTISLFDQGHGIAAPDKLFHAFYTTKSEGMGLGLAICRTVIENHGGKIWAENRVEGGAAFHFRLPLPSLETINSSSHLNSSNTPMQQKIAPSAPAFNSKVNP